MLFSKIVEQPVTARIHLNLEKLQKIEKPQNRGYAACRELRGQQRGWSRSQLRKSTIRTIPRCYHLAEKKKKRKKEEHSALPPKLAGLAASSSAGCTQAVTPSSRHSSRLSSRRSVPPLRSACKMTDESLRPRRRPWARPGQRSAALSRRRSLRAHPVSRPRPPASHPRPSRRGRGLRAPRRRSHRLRAPPP